MYSLQVKGPKRAGQKETIHLSNVYKILKIGINRPYCIPIGQYYATEDFDIRPQIAIDGVTYAIMDNDILEYEGLYQSEMELQFLTNIDAFTVIDLVFIDVDD
jgi:hypothetical protein